MSFQLRPYQRDAVESAKEELKKCVDPILIEGATGCHEKGHPILMHNGSIKKVEDIEVGDVVMGINSSPKTVTSLARGADDMYLITPKNWSDGYVVNKDHILPVEVGGCIIELSILELLIMKRNCINPLILRESKYSYYDKSDFTIKYVGKGDYYGFNLHGDRLYLDGHFNVHHNCGKSLLVSELAIWLKETSGKKVLCTAPSKELVEQNAEKYRSYGFACSMYSASVGKKSIAKDVVFGTPGSIVNDLHKFDDKFSAIVIDECLTGDSLIETSDGQVRLDDPKLKDKSIKCIDEESGTIYYHKANKVWNNGTKHVSLIKTTEGEIKCTENHLLHSEDLWIYSKDVKIGQSLTLDGSKDFVMKKLLRAVVAVAKRLMF